MALKLHVAITASALLAAMFCAETAIAQEQGGILKIHHRDSPPSLSILEEVPISTVLPMMGVFNNLVLYKQDEPQNSLKSIVPELATEWSWSEDGTRLTFQLREGVRWHDGSPFTSKDVQCTWDLLLGRSPEKLRTNPGKAWYHNLEEVSAEGDFGVTFRLSRPQPALLALLASGYSPVYPCHVPPREMRQHPIGTGPFKLAEFKPNEYIKVTRNPDYWKNGRPYLDGIEYRFILNRSCATLAFIAGTLDMTFPWAVTIPMLKDVWSQAPDAICELKTNNVRGTLIVNRNAPPFDNPEMRQAMALTLDRQAYIDILYEGQATVGGAMMPPPEGVWGMPSEMMRKLPGYDADVQKNRMEAHKIMENLGYGSNKHLKIKVATRNIPVFRDPAVIVVDQLKESYIDGELDAVETANYYSKLARKDYQVGFDFLASAVDDPDEQLYENYTCRSERNYTG